jgi:predicted negative regulator of RcsB-dependent stress response
VEWLNEIIAANAKQLPVVGLLGGMCTVLWKAWMKERKDNKALYEARIKDLKTMLKPDDSSDS